ncbi:MAG: hypothetical protein ACLGG7_00100 [Bacteriovoracia bacterium]
MKLTLPLLLLCATSAWGFNKDFTIVNDRAPLEFRLMFESMKYALKEVPEQVRLIVLAQHINKGMGPLKKDQSFFLLKSEIYKSLLEWPHPQTQFQVGSHTLERIQTNMKASQAIYTPFSMWVLESLIADLKTYQAQGLLDLTPAQRSTLSAEKTQQYLKLQKILKYTRGWLEQADTVSAKDFNLLTEDLSWKTLERVKERSALFRRFSSKAIQDSNENTFNIPEQGMPQMAVPKSAIKIEETPKTLAEEGQEQKTEAEAAVESIQVDSSAIPADALSEAIDKIEAEAPEKSSEGLK